MKHLFEGCPDQTVRHNGEPMKPSPVAKELSPRGMSWGDEGPGAQALAHTLLSHLWGREAADAYYRACAREVVARLPATWRLCETDLLDWLARYIIRSGA